MSTNTATVEMTDLQREALNLLAVNAPIPSRITRRTLNSIVKKGWATQDGPTYWITSAGRDAIGVAKGLWQLSDNTVHVHDVMDQVKAERTKSAPRKRTKTPVQCRCGCKGMTSGGDYLPGHDARHAGQVARAVASGEAELEDAIEANFWDKPKLEEKVRRSVALAYEKKAAKAARATLRDEAQAVLDRFIK